MCPSVLVLPVLSLLALASAATNSPSSAPTDFFYTDTFQDSLTTPSAGLNHTSLKFSHATVGEEVEIIISFQATWDFVEGETLVLTMPRYTDGSAIGLYDSREINYDLALSPSIQFQGAWMEGNYNNNVNPYANSRLYLRVKKPLVKSSNFVEIKIYSDNGIKAYCGHPAFDDYKSVNATASGEAFILSSNIAGRPSHTMQQPLMGDACLSNGYCYQRGSCNHCTGQCTCNEGWGASSDNIMTGRDVTTNCFSRKSHVLNHITGVCFGLIFCCICVVDSIAGTCPSGKSISDVPTSATEAHAMTECSSAGTCNRRTGQCECIDPYEGVACQRCKL
jgi:hypothetical protein